MQIVHTIQEVRAAVADARRKGLKIGLVPTMGYLHEGHGSLMANAREDCGFVAVSIFVNPTQFGPKEDLNKYPRDLERDSAMAEQLGVDLIFVPSAEEMYPEGYATYVDVGGITDRLEGASRPGHFRGVATVVAKLFNIFQTDYAYFGQKDYQQLQVIQQMVRDLDFPVEIVPMPTIRESDGLAMSSRNSYLNPEERQQAVVLSQSLELAENMAASGEKNAAIIRDAVRNKIETMPLARVDYISIAHPETLEELNIIQDRAVVSMAVFFGRTRLIDNRVIIMSS